MRCHSAPMKAAASGPVLGSQSSVRSAPAAVRPEAPAGAPHVILIGELVRALAEVLAEVPAGALGRALTGWPTEALAGVLTEV